MLKSITDVFKAILKPANVIFRIVDIYFDPANRLRVRYHSVGKRSCTEEYIEDLINDLMHVQGFSDQDSRIILDAYKSQKIEFPLLIEGVIFNENESILLLKDLELNEQIPMSLKSIQDNLEILGQFNHQDCKTIVMLMFNFLFDQQKAELEASARANNGSKIVQLR